MSSNRSKIFYKAPDIEDAEMLEDNYIVIDDPISHKKEIIKSWNKKDNTDIPTVNTKKNEIQIKQSEKESS